MTDGPAIQELWERIRRRTRFEADIDGEKLIADAMEGIKGMPKGALPTRRYHHVTRYDPMSEA